jgi:hypothetical protein
MHSSDVRYQFYLSRSKVTAGLCLALLCVSLTTLAQRRKKEYVRHYMEHYDDKPLHFGFSFAAPFTRFNIRHSPSFVRNDSTMAIVSPVQPGFRMLFVMNTRLSDRWDFRIAPGISIYGRSVEYRYPGSSYTLLRESTWAELPLMFKYKSERRGNTRMYVVGGVRFGIEANVRKKDLNRGSFERLSTKTNDISLEYGVGLEQFYHFFKFAPELHFSHGLTNMFVPNERSAFSTGIQRLSSHTVTLYLLFE